MPKPTYLSRAVALIPILSLAAAGQVPTSNWENVRMIAPGTEVRIAAGNSKTIRGKLESVTDSNLIVIVIDATGKQSFQRPDIHNVSVKEKGHRLRKVLIGMGVGTAAGLAGGGAAAKNCSGIACGGFDIGVSGAIGFIAGTVGGLIWSREGWRQIYAP
jgi:hypothetical protein